jgi:hypothetical protein
MTCLELNPFGVTDSGRCVQSIDFPEELNITRIVHEMYLPILSFDSNRTKNVVSKKLFILASLVHSLPRTLECTVRAMADWNQTITETNFPEFSKKTFSGIEKILIMYYDENRLDLEALFPLSFSDEVVDLSSHDINHMYYFATSMFVTVLKTLPKKTHPNFKFHPRGNFYRLLGGHH